MIPHRALTRSDEPGKADGTPMSSTTDSFLSEVPLPLDEPTPARVGSYRIVRMLGQGGMGRVYEAEQECPRRSVALKVVRPHLTTANYRRKFSEEIRALGRFDHPGIARIHEAGAAPDDHGAMRVYIAMELVDGLRADEHVTKHRLDARAVAALLVKVCAPVQHAHQKSVIHCDLKPANVIIAPDGTPKILDFGVARIVGEDALDRTATIDAGDPTSIAATLAFASPEQASGRHHCVDALTDVYGLGAILFALLTGRPPHDLKGRSIGDAVRAVLDEPPTRLRSLRPECPRDLETIVMKAMAREPQQRYESAAALAADLSRFVEDRPILARPAAWHEVTRKWMRRNRLSAWSAGTAMFAIVAGVTGISIGLLRTQEEHRHHAETRSAIQGALLDVDGRFQRARVCWEHLRRDEAPEYAGRILALGPWLPDTLAARSGMALLTLNARGEVIDGLDGTRRLVPWAKPAFDVGGRFARAVYAPAPYITKCVAYADMIGDARRECVRALRELDDTHTHFSVIELADVASMVRATGTSAQAAPIQLWSKGVVNDIVWDEDRRLLWTLSNANELPYFVPELVGWDASRCPSTRDEPTLLVAFDPSDMAARDGVLPPLAGDATHPPIATRWAFLTRAPQGVRPEKPRTTDVRFQTAIVEIQGFEPARFTSGGPLGIVFVAFAEPGADRRVIASIEIDGAGQPVGDFQLASTIDDGERARDLALIEQFDPRDEIVCIDLNDASEAIPDAQRTLIAKVKLSSALDAVRRDRHLNDRQKSSRVRALEAMAGNWRWLLNAAGEIVEAPALIARLGEPLESSEAAGVAGAVEWLHGARRIHDDRCPAHGDGRCTCSWLIDNELALAYAAHADWQACERTAHVAIDDRVRSAQAPDATDHALLAIALARLGRPEEANEALTESERILSATGASGSAQGSTDQLAPRLVLRTRSIVRGD